MKEILRKRICIVTAAPLTINAFMRSHLAILRESCDIVVVVHGTPEDMDVAFDEHVSFLPLRIERKISIRHDLSALLKLWSLFRKEKFDCVYSLMPKGGLLGMVAARIACIPVRLHVFNGEVWASKHGFMRALLRTTDRITAACASTLLAVSPSQRSFLIGSGIVGPEKIGVVADGSITGVNLQRFAYDEAARDEVRTQHQIPQDGLVFLFIGRLNHDKGLLDLSRAFAKAALEVTNIHLFVVGPDEEGLGEEFCRLAEYLPGRVHRVDFTKFPERYMSASDVICLPSYREGFGMVLIEAASVGVPAIASRIYGISDAVEDGATGILHQVGSVTEIAEAMVRLASDGGMRRRFGEQAKSRVTERFSEERVISAFAQFYRQLLSL